MYTDLDEFYENKTSKFLAPCLKSYGKVFVNYLNTLYKLSFGINDKEKDRKTLSSSKVIYCLIKNKEKPSLSKVFIKWVKDQEYYVTHYNPKGDLDRTMIVIKIPEEYLKAYKHFAYGEYSKMYSDEDKVKLFLDKGRSIEYGVLNKESEALRSFTKRVNMIFNVKVNLRDFEDAECEFPLIINEEIFNSNVKDKIFLT